MDRDLVEATQKEFERRGTVAQLQFAVAIEVDRIARLVQAAAQPYLLEWNLTFAGWQALVALSFSKEKALPTTELARRVGTHPTTLTRTIDRLVRMDFVRRVPKEGDRRVNIVEILPKGEEAQQGVVDSLDESQINMPVSETVLEDLAELLREVRLAMTARLD